MKKILIVDDDKDVLEAMQLLLTEAGYKSCAVLQVGEMFACLKESLPDLIVLDVLLSGQDGRMVARQLRKRRDTRGIPIIMVSAHPSAAQSAISCGANDFVAKPFEVDELISKVSKHMG